MTYPIVSERFLDRRSAAPDDNTLAASRDVTQVKMSEANSRLTVDAKYNFRRCSEMVATAWSLKEPVRNLNFGLIVADEARFVKSAAGV